MAKLPKTPKSIPLPPASSEEQARWKAAAAKESCSMVEFQRRALNERTQNVLYPGSRMLGGVAESIGRLVTGKPVIANPIHQEEICGCGHSTYVHRRGIFQCSTFMCDCKEFRKFEGRSLGPKP